MNGVANCVVTVNQPRGPGTVSASFSGDSYHQPSSSTQPTLVYAFPAGGGAIAIGDGNAALGTAVTFWGAQWWKLNSVSGGTGPQAFKGFAKNPALPACGAGWDTGPGNRPDPPSAPLPGYMGVIVTSSVAKSGASIAGNTPRLVVMQTAAGYDGNPGHVGTGTVVGTVCH